MNSASLCSLAGQYGNPIPTRFLAHIDSLKIPVNFSPPPSPHEGNTEEQKGYVVFILNLHISAGKGAGVMRGGVTPPAPTPFYNRLLG